MGAAALPLAVVGGSIGSSLIGGKMAKSAQQAAMRRSPEETRLMGAQTDLLQQLTGQGRTLFSNAMPALGAATGYQQRVLGGDRATLADLVAPDARRVRDLYGGAEAGVRATARGGERDLALSRLSRDRTGALAGLTTGLRGQAAGALGQLGYGQLYPAMTAGGAAVGGYGGLLSQSQQNRQQAFGYGQQTGGQFGGTMGALLADLLSYYATRGKAPSRGGALAGAP